MEHSEECINTIKFLLSLLKMDDPNTRIYVLGSKKLLSFIFSLLRVQINTHNIQIINILSQKHSTEILMITLKNNKQFENKLEFFQQLAKSISEKAKSVEDDLSDDIKCKHPLSEKR